MAATTNQPKARRPAAKPARVVLISPQQKPKFVPRPKGGTPPGHKPTTRRA